MNWQQGREFATTLLAETVKDLAGTSSEDLEYRVTEIERAFRVAVDLDFPLFSRGEWYQLDSELDAIQGELVARAAGLDRAP